MPEDKLTQAQRVRLEAFAQARMIHDQAHNRVYGLAVVKEMAEAIEAWLWEAKDLSPNQPSF